MEMSDNVIDLTLTSNNLKFIKDVIVNEKINEDTGETIYDQRVVIKLLNTKNGRARIHRYTEFLNQWRNNKTKTAVNHADRIVPFLNYLYFELNKIELPSIKDLTWEIGAAFLERCGEKASKAQVDLYEATISRFYYFLAKKHMLKNISVNDFVFVEKHNRVVMLSPFNGKYKSPAPNTNKDLHHLEQELIFTFLETGLMVEPRIALGLYFQLFGGLRISEVVSLEYENISFKGANGINGMVLNITNKYLRTDIKTGSINQPKKAREQGVISVGDMLPKLYTNHKKIYQSADTNALFIDNNGNPMTQGTYRRSFNKVKNAFIERLKTDENPKFKVYSTFLNAQHWSTHIGRGIFSNMIANVANNVLEVMTWRNDSSPNSSATYLSDGKAVETKVIAVMEKMYNSSLKGKLDSYMFRGFCLKILH